MFLLINNEMKMKKVEKEGGVAKNTHCLLTEEGACGGHVVAVRAVGGAVLLVRCCIIRVVAACHARWRS